MSDLIEFVLDTHGGTAPWERATQLSATMRVYGDFWASRPSTRTFANSASE